MAGNLLNAAKSVQAGTITAALLASSFNLPTVQLADGAKLVFTDGTRAMTASLSMGGNTVTSVGSPVNATDAATKAYVDAVRNGVRLHFARVVANANVTLSNTQTIDGVSLAVGDEVLLIGQTTASQNGLWLVQSGNWVRPPDWAAAAQLPEGQYVIVDPDGTNYKNTKWICNNTGTITVDTTSTSFVQDLSGTVYQAGGGLQLSGVTFAAKVGNGVALDGNSALTLTPDPNRLLQVVAAGVGVKDGTAAQLLMANSSGNASYQTLSGDATISSAGVLALSATVLRYAGIVTNEIPGGTVNGTNAAFTLANTPQVAPAVYKNGQRMLPGASNDYTFSGNTITFVTAPVTGDQLQVDYEK